METAPQLRPPKKETRPLSVIIGMLLVPLSAVAAYALTGPPPESEVLSAPVSTAATTSVAISGPVVSDIEEACGPAGIALVNAEGDGTITEIQQAALTALRDICNSQGFQLPGAVAPTDGTGLVVQNSNPTPPPVPSVNQSPDDDHEDDDDDDDHDDDHWEDD